MYVLFNPLIVSILLFLLEYVYKLAEVIKTNLGLFFFCHIFKNGTLSTGQYLVLKYRSPDQIGCLEIYSSTQNASASGGGNNMGLTKENGLYIADDQWHLVIIDLSKKLVTYTADGNGKYAAKHLRLDLFNLGSPLEEGVTTYVDFAYIGLCDDYTEILANDPTVSEYLFYDGESVTAKPTK